MPDFNRILRRLYADLIKRRTRVLIHRSVEASAGLPPLFVIGLFRSGTTLMRYLLDSHSRIACPPETRFMQHLSAMLGSERTMNGMAAMGYDRAHVVQELRRTINYFMENYARSKNKPRWADKTPEYTEILPFLQEVFPDGRFVMLYRHPLDQIWSNVRSGLGAADRIGRFMNPVESVHEAAARYWTEQTGRMLEFEQAFPSMTHRIRYEDLCADPESRMTSVLEFAGEAWEPAILEYYRFEHDYGAEDGKVGTSRQIERSVHDPSRWNPEEYNRCAAIVASVAKRIGYELVEARAGGVPETGSTAE